MAGARVVKSAHTARKFLPSPITALQRESTILPSARVPTVSEVLKRRAESHKREGPFHFVRLTVLGCVESIQRRRVLSLRANTTCTMS
jgi:hypothetical protein